jgi:hypothetical protein
MDNIQNNTPQEGEKLVQLSPEAAQFLEQKMAAERTQKEQQELVQKGLNGELGLKGDMFKELYEKGNLKQKIEKWGFNKSNAQMLVESSIEAYQASAQQKTEEPAQALPPAGLNQSHENVTAKLAQQAATGGQVGHTAKKADDKSMQEQIVPGQPIDYDRLDKVNNETKFTHSIVSQWKR